MSSVVPLRALRRAPGEVHLGLGGADPVVLGGLSEAETRAVVTLGAMTVAQWRSARSSRPPSKRWDTVLQLIGDAAADLIGPDVIPGEVAVSGTGTVPDAIRGVLGRITRPDPTRLGNPALVVLVAAEHLHSLTAEPWQAAGVPQLPVVIGPRRAAVGPILQPGRGPCLRCMDLQRAARDPAWARLTAALLPSAPDATGPPAHAPADFASVIAGLVGMAARQHLGGAPSAPGHQLVLTGPRPRVQHLLWRADPRCCPEADGWCAMMEV